MTDADAAKTPRKRLTSVERLVKRLREEHGIDLGSERGDYYFESHRMSQGDREAGCWSWDILVVGVGQPVERIGSQWSVGELLKAKTWAVDPYQENQHSMIRGRSHLAEVRGTLEIEPIFDAAS